MWKQEYKSESMYNYAAYWNQPIAIKVRANHAIANYSKIVRKRKLN